MNTATTEQLTKKRCAPCEGGVPPLSAPEAEQLLEGLEDWALSDDRRWIHRAWTFPNFRVAIQAVNRIAELAEEEGHHPDLHLTGYKNLTVELTTHAIQGLSENDFILAAKIDQDLKANLA